MEDILTFGRYCREEFGETVYKIPISLSGFTCPNIDGTVAYGGCSFCLNDSFSPNIQNRKDIKFYLNNKSSQNPILDLQLKELKEQFLKTRNRLQEFGVKKFIIYFQSFTNTYAPFETLKILYKEALSFKDVIGISIGTRTDCINEEILSYLASLNQNREIWIEYGVQTIFDETLQKINRGHLYSNMEFWIKKTKENNLKICSHLIFGLPNETQEMMLKSTQKMIDLNVNSIKFHPLYVVKNTLLGVEFLKGKFTPISKELYIDTLIKAIKLLPKDIIVQRVSAGDATLLAPNWCNSKTKIMGDIRKALLKEGLRY